MAPSWCGSPTSATATTRSSCPRSASSADLRFPVISATADDRSLIAASRAGDRSALDALLRRHHDRWWALCRRLAGNDADGHDALQEALIAVVRGLPRFDGRAAFTTWAYRVVTNAALDELRRRRRRPVAALPDLDGAAAPVAPGPPVDGFVAERLDVDAAVARLPEDFRVAVVLRDLCDLEYADIAGILGIPPGTVRSRIARGRAQLADVLGNQAPAPDRPTPQP